MPESAIRQFNAGGPVLVSSEVLLSYLRAAWKAGNVAARDPYAWHDISDLVDYRRVP